MRASLLAGCCLLAGAAAAGEIPAGVQWGSMGFEGVFLGLRVEPVVIRVGQPLNVTVYLQNRGPQEQVVPVLDEGNTVLFLDELRVQVDPTRKFALAPIKPGETREFGFSLGTSKERPRTVAVRAALRNQVQGEESAFLRAAPVEVLIEEGGGGGIKAGD
jgi:hypothetical protein